MKWFLIGYLIGTIGYLLYGVLKEKIDDWRWELGYKKRRKKREQEIVDRLAAKQKQKVWQEMEEELGVKEGYGLMTKGDAARLYAESDLAPWEHAWIDKIEKQRKIDHHDNYIDFSEDNKSSS